MTTPLFSSGSELDPGVVEAAREDLRRRLPELRELPGFPIGSDEDILAMSVPPYYTACPNPFIQDWLVASEGGSHPDSQYRDPGPFVWDVSEGKGHALYRAHSFWTKVPHKAIMRYILHYTQPGDVVLDGFCGSGMTGVAAQACGDPEPDFRRDIEADDPDVEWGQRRAVLQDLGPAATFIAAGLTLPFDPDDFDRQSRAVLDSFDQRLGWMYKTTHSDSSIVDIDYTIWSEVFTCKSCGSPIVYYDAAFDEARETVRDSFPCGRCGSVWKKPQLDKRRVSRRTVHGDLQERSEFRPVKIFYRVDGQIFAKTPDDTDRDLLDRIHRFDSAGYYPSAEIPIDKLWHGYMFGPSGITRMHHLWSDRGLIAIADLWAQAASVDDPGTRQSLLFWIEQSLWGLFLDEPVHGSPILADESADDGCLLLPFIAR